MKAVGLYQHLPVDDPDCLVDVEVGRPEPDDRDLLVRVQAVSVNPVDTKQRRRGDERRDQPRILGWDAAGTVEAVGEDVELFEVGDEVYYAGDITRPGCNSAYHAVDERIVGRKPANLSFEEAAALPLTTITAWEALFDRLDVGGADAGGDRGTLLIIGGAGGVGSIATQLATQLAGLEVIATASREESRKWCRHMGAAETINHYEPFGEEFERIGADEVDYICCFNSTASHIDNMAQVIAPQGAICTIVSGGQPLDVDRFKSRSVRFCWEFMFTRPVFETADMRAQHELLNQAADLVEEGTLQTTVTERFGALTAANLREAHAAVEEGHMIGKAVLGGVPDADADQPTAT